MKYEILKNKSVTLANGTVLYRIKALKDFYTTDGCLVTGGTIGGWITSEKVLSQEGECWIDNTCCVYSESSRIFDNALLKNDSSIDGKNILISGSSVIDNCSINGNGIKIKGNAFISDGSCISGKVLISGSPQIFNSKIEQDGRKAIRISDHAKVVGSTLKNGVTIKDFAVIGRSLICNNSIVRGASIIRSSSLVGNIVVDRGIEIIDSFLNGSYNIVSPFFDLSTLSYNYNAVIKMAYSDDKHPIRVYPSFLHDKWSCLSIYHTRNKNKDLTINLSFSEDSNINGFITTDDFINKIKKLLKENTDKAQFNDSKVIINDFFLKNNHTLLQTAQYGSNNFFSLLQEITLEDISDEVFNEIKYYIFSQLIGIIVSNIDKKKAHAFIGLVNNRCSRLIDIASVDFKNNKLISLSDIVPYNKDMLIYIYNNYKDSLSSDWINKNMKIVSSHDNAFFV